MLLSLLYSVTVPLMVTLWQVIRSCADHMGCVSGCLNGPISCLTWIAGTISVSGMLQKFRSFRPISLIFLNLCFVILFRSPSLR